MLGNSPQCNYQGGPLSYLRLIRAQEFIEVIDSFLQREEITLIGATPNDLTLQLLLLNISRGKLFTLCWRTLLHFKKLNYHGEDFILFTEIMSRIDELYRWYRGGNGHLKPYDSLMETQNTLISTLLVRNVLRIRKRDFCLNDIVRMKTTSSFDGLPTL